MRSTNGVTRRVGIALVRPRGYVWLVKPAKYETFTWLPVPPPKSQAMEMSRQNAAHAIPNVATIVAPHVLALASVLTARPVTYERGWPPRYLRAMPYFITIAVPPAPPTRPTAAEVICPVHCTAYHR